jgi:hypothetical protein
VGGNDIFFSMLDWQWTDKTAHAPHRLVLSGAQERYVRAYMYKMIGKKGAFALHFDDLKFSIPMLMAHGKGVVHFENSEILYNVGECNTELFSESSKALVNFVLSALDELCE